MPATFRSAALVAIALGVVTDVVPARAQPAPSGGCPAAREAWVAGEAARAETLSRACLRVAPDDPGVWYELARALAAHGRYDEALIWLRRGVSAHPDDMDWRVLGVRILAWSGDLDGAWRYAGALTPAGLSDPETARLVADVAFWRRRNADAARLYTSWLDRFGTDASVYRNRGLVYLALDQPVRALADARKACELANTHCDEYDDLRKRFSTYDVLAEVRLTRASAADDWGDVILGVSRRFPSGTQIGGRVDLQDRFGTTGGTLAVVTASAKLALRARWVILSAAAVGSFDSPLNFSAQVEPGHAFRFGLEAYLKLWYLDYTTGDVGIASPTVIFTRPRYELRARYFLTQKSETGLTHAVAGEGHYTGLAHYRFVLAASGGESADVDDALGEGLIEQFWQVGIAASRALSWRQSITVGYWLRVGTVDLGIPLRDDREFRRGRFALQYQLKL